MYKLRRCCKRPAPAPPHTTPSGPLCQGLDGRSFELHRLCSVDAGGHGRLCEQVDRRGCGGRAPVSRTSERRSRRAAALCRWPQPRTAYRYTPVGHTRSDQRTKALTSSFKFPGGEITCNRVRHRRLSPPARPLPVWGRGRSSKHRAGPHVSQPSPHQARSLSPLSQSETGWGPVR